MRELQFLLNRLPFYVIFYPTSRCNARCPHCYNYNRETTAVKDQELRLEEIEKIARGFGHIKALTISGGEPFLRDDLAEIIPLFYTHAGLQYVSFHTNGFLPKRVTDVVAQVLRTLPRLQVIVCISIDGIGEIHDQFRGVQGGFQKVLETIAALKKLQDTYKNLDLIASTIFSHSTQDTFLETIRFIEQDIGGIKPSLSFIRGRVRDETETAIDFTKYQDFHRNFHPNHNAHIPRFSPLAIKETLEMLVNKIVVENLVAHQQTIPCQAGRKLAVIYENGDVYPCETLNMPFGNLRDVNFDIKQLLFSDSGKAIIQEVGKTQTCASCTWENAILVNLLFSVKNYPRILSEWFRRFLLKQ